MKKIYLTLIGLISLFAEAQQPVVTPSPATVNDLITITYGSGSGNTWTYLDPQSENPLYVYLGLDTDNNATTWEFHDNWVNCNASNLIPMYWNSVNNRYEVTIDLKTHNFDGSGGILPVGTTVYNGKYVIRRSLTHECAANPSDPTTWQGTDQNFVITPAVVTLGTGEIHLNQKIAEICESQLYLYKSGKYQITIQDLSGRILKEFNIKSSGNTLHNLETDKKAVYLCIVKNEQGEQQVIKFIP